MSLSTKKSVERSCRAEAAIEMAIVIHKYIILIIRYKSVLENGRTIHTCGSRTQRKNRRFFCLFARGGTNLKIDKDSRMGWANKQKRDARHKHLVKISRGEEVTPAELLQPVSAGAPEDRQQKPYEEVV